MLLNKLFKSLMLLLICFSLADKTLAVDPEVIAKKVLCRSCLAKIYVAEGLYPEASTEYSELLKLTPNDASAHFEYANLLAKTEKPDQAVSHYKTAAKLKPTVPEYQVGLGNAYMFTRNFDAAVQAYTRACTLGGKYQTQLQQAQQYQAQQKLLDQYKQKVQERQESNE